MPNAWFPIPGHMLTLEGATANDLAALCKGQAIVSHVRYEDHAAKISEELGIDLPSSGENAPSPFNSNDVFIVASRRFDGGVDYVKVSANDKTRW